MKIFAIREESDSSQADLAYLLYYERQKTFYIEVPEERSEWEVPLLISSFVKRGEYTLNAYWSKIWVRQRIVPADRQNLGQILKENGLKEYDEYRLLMLGNGRCAQDDYYLKAVTEEALGGLKERFRTKVEDVLPLEDANVLVFFRDGTIRKCPLRQYFEKNRSFRALLLYPGFFEDVKVQVGGYGICWNEETVISDREIYGMGEAVPLSFGDFCRYVARNLISGAEAADLLECSRQNIEKLVESGRLHPLKRLPKSTLFLRAEVEQRKADT